MTTTSDFRTTAADPPAPPPKGQGYAKRPVQRETGRLHRDQIAAVARTELKQLIQAKDFWGPMVGLGAIFFCVVPTILLFSLTSIASVDAVEQISQTLEVLPDRAQESIEASTGGEEASPQGQASYALAVFLFAPVAVVVPLTISTAVGAATIVGERERGTGEFLAHSPAGVREIYLGKLLASLVPGYATTVVGFGIYSLIVNLIVGPEVGGWFFPTTQWWILMAWVVPPFLALTLSVVLRLSARVKSTAAAQQASGLVSLPLIMVAYSQSTGALFGGSRVTWIIGGLAWLLAILGLRRGMRAVSRARLLGVADEQ
ncbi:MAG TPA: ABC transporter permease subunit [Acidimicrobiales bacterium]